MTRAERDVESLKGARGVQQPVSALGVHDVDLNSERNGEQVKRDSDV